MMLLSLKRDLQLRIAALLPGSMLARLQCSGRVFDEEFIREAVVLAAHQIGRSVPVQHGMTTWTQWHDAGENCQRQELAILCAIVHINKMFVHRGGHASAHLKNQMQALLSVALP